MLSKKELQYMNNGKIYKIVCNVTGDVYYGSTIQSLKRRLTKHKVDYKRYLNGKTRYVTSFKIIETGDYNIHLVEDYACLCKKQLEAIERIYIERYTCINKYIPTRTTKQYRKEYIKEYHKKNLDKLNEYKKKYRENNRHKINQKFNCPCGGKYTRAHKARHMKSKKHINYRN